MKNKYVPCNNSDVVKKHKINKTLSTTVSNSTKEVSSNGKNKLKILIDQEEKIQKVKLDLIEIINDDVTFNDKKGLIENESEIYKLLMPRGDKKKDSNNNLIPNSTKNEENLSSTNSRAREDSITAEVRESFQSPNNTDNELGKFFSKEEEKVCEGEENLSQPLNNFNAKQIIERGMQHKIRANSLFKKNKFKDSLTEYLKAVEEINTLLNHKTQGINLTNINWLRLECLNNIAVCYLLLKEYNKVLYYTEQVLKINPNNVNALYYRAKGFIPMKMYLETSECLKKALSIKYSKRLMSLLNEIEGKLDVNSKGISLSINGDDKNNELNGNKNNFKNSGIENSNLDDGSKKSSISKTDTNSNLSQKNDKENNSNDKEKLYMKNLKKNPPNKSFLFSLIFSIFKFSKILSISVLEFLKRHKYGILILIIIWIITFRTSFKNKLLNMLRIRFN